MQQNNNAATSTAVCLWCNSQFLKGTSRAQDGQAFCARSAKSERDSGFTPTWNLLASEKRSKNPKNAW